MKALIVRLASRVPSLRGQRVVSRVLAVVWPGFRHV